jgi:hypothetical protein
VRQASFRSWLLPLRTRARTALLDLPSPPSPQLAPNASTEDINFKVVPLMCCVLAAQQVSIPQQKINHAKRARLESFRSWLLLSNTAVSFALQEQNSKVQQDFVHRVKLDLFKIQTVKRMLLVSLVAQEAILWQ